MGLERPDSGEIWVDGTNLVGLGERDLDRIRRKFAVVFQKYALLDSMSVFDNVAFPLREETGLSDGEIARRVHSALRELDVDDAARKLPGELSGGMERRVGIARAVVTEPEILVYDDRRQALIPRRRTHRAHADRPWRDVRRHHARHGDRLRGPGPRGSSRGRKRRCLGTPGGALLLPRERSRAVRQCERRGPRPARVSGNARIARDDTRALGKSASSKTRVRTGHAGLHPDGSGPYRTDCVSAQELRRADRGGICDVAKMLCFVVGRPRLPRLAHALDHPKAGALPCWTRDPRSFREAVRISQTKQRAEFSSCESACVVLCPPPSGFIGSESNVLSAAPGTNGAGRVKVRPRVLIVDDDLDTSEGLSTLLNRDGYSCERASSGLDALQVITRGSFDVVVSDVKMPGMSGLDLLDRIIKIHPMLPVILCTGFSEIAGAVDATKRGAFQYLQKPCDFSALKVIVASAIRERRVAAVPVSTDGGSKLHLARPRGKALKGHAEAAAPPLMLGVDPAMLTLQQSIASVAASSAPVLILGESGTGKDLVARAIHAAGARRDHAFVAVNVSAIPEHLLESEIFGHVRGAFTGASEARRGLLLEAHGGTLFLDEIGDMPIGLQAKLLRVLQFGELRPVGSDTARRVDVRIVTATHRDLPKLIEAGRFREDLYFRIRVLPIVVPPLRERRGDIVSLARHFLEGAQRRTPTSPVVSLGPDAERILSSAAWPGNVRELESTMERLVVFGKAATVHAGDLYFLSRELPVVSQRTESTDLASLRDVSERHVAQILLATHGDKRRAAEILGIDLSTLYRWKQRKPTA